MRLTVDHFWIAASAIACVMAGATIARPHEIYRDFYSGGAPGIGRWCCSGNTEGTTGDCAPAEYTLLRDGSAVMVSKRYPGKQIRVAASRILWLTIPGGEAYEAHLCAIPRAAGSTPTEDDPDPEFSTICAAINPRGF